MELTLLAVAPDGTASPVRITAGPTATVAEIAAALARHTCGLAWGTPALFLGEHPLDPAARVGDTGLLCGAAVGIGCPVVDGPRPAGPAGDDGLELAVIGGPGAGRSVQLPPQSSVTVGRGSASDLVVDDREVSRTHLTVSADGDGTGRVSDAGSSNGTAVNGVRVLGATDVAGGDVVEAGRSVLAVRPVEASAPLLAAHDQPGLVGVNRPPRLQRPAPAPSVTIPTQPGEPQTRRFPLIAVLMPLLLGGVLVVVTHSAYAACFVLLSPLMAAANYFGDRRTGRRDYRQRLAEYRQALADLDATLDRMVIDEQRTARHEQPDPAAVLRIVSGPTGRLWERRTGDPDFGLARVGLADRPSRIEVHGLPPGKEPPRAATVHAVPVTVSVPGAGVIGLAGPPDDTQPLVRAMIANLVALHSPTELRVAVFAPYERPDPAGDRWQWVRWLPHAAAPAAAWPLPGLVGCGPEAAAVLVNELSRLIDEREESAPSRGSQRGDGARPSPALVVVVDGARRARGYPGLTRLLRDGPNAGVYALCLEPEESHLPGECRAVVAPDPEGRYELRQDEAHPVPGIRIDGLSPGLADRLARMLAPARDLGTVRGHDTIPSRVRLIDLLGLDDPGPEAIRRTWDASPGGRSTRATLGVELGGPFTVDLRRDGPHALVAGTTGAGKSELLQTLIASLAAANRPDALNFVLVDYKGGSAFRECALLPHCAGMITDLDGHLAGRALASLHAELSRRERLFAELGATDIDDYWARTTAGGARGAAWAASPLARLVIVIDEFATLAEEVPEFVDGVVGIGMRGRSLGIHVMLATQRPGGVVSAEIRANMNLRICLRVANQAESNDVVDVPDAARIPTSLPGRAVALRGYGELTSFQTARVAAPVPQRDAGVESGQPVVEDLTPPYVPPSRSDTPDGTREATDLLALVEAIREASLMAGIPAGGSVWHPPLPDVVHPEQAWAAATAWLDENGTLMTGPADGAGGVGAAVATGVAGAVGAVGAIGAAGGGDGRADLRALVGLADIPERQAQLPFRVDLAQAGSLLVLGTVRSGRSSALRAIVASLAAANPPDRLQCYGVDCGNRALASLAALPHCGAIVDAGDPERVARLLDLLDEIVQTRQQSSWGSGDGRDRPAHILVLIDGMDGFVARLGELDNGRLLDQVYRLLRDGPAVGLTFAITTDRTAFTGRLASAIPGRLVLPQADRDDYSLVGIERRAIPSAKGPGRGVWAATGHEVQVALLDADPAEAAQTRAVERLAERWRQQPTRPDGRPRRLDALPPLVTLDEADALSAAVPVPPGFVALVGVGGDELGPVRVDLEQAGPAFVIAGPPRSGRSTALVAMARSLAAAGGPLILLSPRPSPLRDLEGHPGVAAVLSGRDGADELRAVLRATGPAAVLVDDAELFADGPAAKILEDVVRTARDEGVVVVAAATTDDLLASRYRGWLAEARRSRAGLLLAPSSHVDGEVLDVKLPRHIGRDWPAGRALLAVRGATSMVQVPTAYTPCAPSGPRA